MEVRRCSVYDLMDGVRRGMRKNDGICEEEMG